MKELTSELDYLHKLRRFEEIKPGLTTMENLMSALGNPHQKFDSIHIAGTNGKGSTAAFLSHALIANRYQAGLYTSPYLVDFNERIQINNHNISDQDLISLISQVRTVATKHKINATFFEFTTALAFLFFSQQKVDIAVIETGMGGLLDATNIITPQASVITNIGLDHQKWLGETRQDIAKRKAGIIKQQVPTITAETDPEIKTLLSQASQAKQSDFIPTPRTTKISNTHSKQVFSIKNNKEKFTIPLIGEHQITNAVTALTALNIIQKTHPTDIELTRKGLAKTKWPGRLQIISQNPFILLDGAHNPEGINSLLTTLNNKQLPSPDTLIIGLKKDKDPTMIIPLANLFQKIIVTESNFEPMPAKQLAKSIRHQNIKIIPNIEQALKSAQKNLKPDSMILITGSLYLIGDVLKKATRK